MAYDNTNRGVLFLNEKKEKENQPDYTGTLDVDGVAYRLAGWQKESKTGVTYFSLSVQLAKGNRG